MEVDFKQIYANLKKGAYQCIGTGSGRRVYDLRNGYVVKVARNKKGLAQNQAEYQIALMNHSNLFAKIPSVSNEYEMLLMEKADKIKKISEVWEYFGVNNNKEFYQLKEIRNIALLYDLLLPDLTRPVNWGKIDGKPVIIDYGFTWKVRKRYYSFF